jgi:hypothetical protein
VSPRQLGQLQPQRTKLDELADELLQTPGATVWWLAALDCQRSGELGAAEYALQRIVEQHARWSQPAHELHTLVEPHADGCDACSGCAAHFRATGPGPHDAELNDCPNDPTIECDLHGPQLVVDEGSVPGFCAGTISWATLACGCQHVDDGSYLES